MKTTAPRGILAPFGVMLVLLALACDDAGEPLPDLSPTTVPLSIRVLEMPTPTPTPTPPPHVPLMVTPGLREFAERLDQALVTRDVQFFLDNVAFVPTRCDAVFGTPRSCTDPVPVPEGEKPRGIFVSDRVVDMVTVTSLQSEGYGLDHAEYEPYIRQFVLSFDASASDAYGDGRSQLFALGRMRDPYPVADVELIATNIAGPRLEFSHFFPGEGQRSVLSFGVTFDGQRWVIQHLMVAPIDYVLDGDSEEALQLFESWQRWPE